MRYLVTLSDGRFFGWGDKLVREYPNARLFDEAGVARRLAKNFNSARGKVRTCIAHAVSEKAYAEGVALESESD